MEMESSEEYQALCGFELHRGTMSCEVLEDFWDLKQPINHGS